MQKHSFFFLGLMLTALIVIRCANPFAPALADENAGQNSLLTEQKSPGEVLLNFAFAYSFKDSLVYSELLDSTFIFVSTNFNVSPPEPINWGRDQELRVVGRMFRFFNTLDITFNEPIRSDTLQRNDNGQATRVQETLTFTLTLDGGGADPVFNGEVVFQYVLRDDERWYIARWEDKVI